MPAGFISQHLHRVAWIAVRLIGCAEIKVLLAENMCKDNMCKDEVRDLQQLY
jgi:hypothetical protein